MAKIAELFERAEREEIRALISVPPQHGKTETILHGCARLLRRHPNWTIGYTSYSAQIANSKSRSARDYALHAGVRLRGDSTSVAEWRTTAGGGMLARGIGGGLTSHGLRLLVIDDPHKDRAEAESALERQRVYDWYTSTARTRVHPGASIIVCHTRWNDDDLIGRLSREEKEAEEGAKEGWEIINLPAIDESGRPLWHERPQRFLERQRRAIGEYDWWSLYMGSPRSRGKAVFRGVKFYDQLPSTFRVGKGIDLAYTAKTMADASVAVVLLESEGYYYVVDVQRAQVEAPEFARTLSAMDIAWPVPSWHWFCSSIEKVVADLLESLATNSGIDAVHATSDKFIRAQSVAAAWNEGRVLVPRDAPWLKTFVDEICNFKGVGDRYDDQVDALASAFESLRATPRAHGSHLETSDFETRGVGGI